MNARFANRLPPIYQRDQVPIDSAVRVLLRDIENAAPGVSPSAIDP